MPDLKRPDITIPNSTEVYSYFANLERDKAARDNSLETMSKLIVPEVQWVDGAQQELETVLESGNPVVFLMNHTTNLDPITLGSQFWRDPLLRRFMDNTRIASKFSLFKYGPIADLIEDIGSVPIPRTKDMEGGKVNKKQMKAATDLFFDFFDESVRARLESWIIFPGGTRNKNNRTVMPPPLAGTARMLMRANDLETPLTTVSIGDYHPPLRLLNPGEHRRPSLVIGMPDKTRWQDKKAASEHIRASIQQNIDQAHANYLDRKSSR